MPVENLAELAATHESVLVLNYSQYIIYGAATLAVAWGGWKAHQVSLFIFLIAMCRSPKSKLNKKNLSPMFQMPTRMNSRKSVKQEKIA